MDNLKKMILEAIEKGQAKISEVDVSEGRIWRQFNEKRIEKNDIIRKELKSFTDFDQWYLRIDLSESEKELYSSFYNVMTDFEVQGIVEWGHHYLLNGGIIAKDTIIDKILTKFGRQYVLVGAIGNMIYVYSNMSQRSKIIGAVAVELHQVRNA